MHVDVNVSSSRSAPLGVQLPRPARLLELDRRSLSNSPQPGADGQAPGLRLALLAHLLPGGQEEGVPQQDGVRVESFEDRSRPLSLPAALTKPRSICLNASTLTTRTSRP